jgi:hypothetical protein
VTIKKTLGIVVVAAAMGLAACSDDSGSSATTTGPTSGPVTSTSSSPTVAGGSTPAAPSSSSSPSTTATPAPLTVAKKSEKATGKGWSWSLTYPEVSGSPAATAINGILTTAARNGVAQYEADAKSPDGPAADPDLAWTYEVTSETAEPAPGLLVARLTTYVYTGGAHGSQLLDVHTFDLRTGQDLSLASVFKPGSSYLERFAAEAPGLILDKLQDQGVSEADVASWADGYGPKPENYATWEPTAAGVKITFAQYQLGAYALGMPEIVIGWDKLRDLLASDSPVATLEG